MPKISVQKIVKKITAKLTPISKSDDVDGWEFSDKISCIFYGESGTGKTTMWETFPGKTFVLLCSGGRKPGELRSINTPENRKRITARVVTSMDQAKRYIDEMKEGGYENVILDHVTGLLDLALKDVMCVEEIPEQKSWGFTDQATWGQAIGMSKDVCREILSLNANVVIIGQERTTQPKEDSEIQEVKIGVDCSPSLAGWLNYSCDYVCQTFKRPVTETLTIKHKDDKGKETTKQVTRRKGNKQEYCLRVAPHDVFTTKFRVTKDIALSLPELIVDPSYDKLIKVIAGEKLAKS